jgi:hypothetical protein
VEEEGEGCGCRAEGIGKIWFGRGILNRFKNSSNCKGKREMKELSKICWIDCYITQLKKEKWRYAGKIMFHWCQTERFTLENGADVNSILNESNPVFPLGTAEDRLKPIDKKRLLLLQEEKIRSSWLFWSQKEPIKSQETGLLFMLPDKLFSCIFNSKRRTESSPYACFRKMGLTSTVRNLSTEILLSWSVHFIQVSRTSPFWLLDSLD